MLLMNATFGMSTNDVSFKSALLESLVSEKASCIHAPFVSLQYTKALWVPFHSCYYPYPP